MSTSRHGHLQVAGGMLLADGVEKEEGGQRSQLSSGGTTGHFDGKGRGRDLFSGHEYRPSEASQGSRVPRRSGVAGAQGGPRAGAGIQV